MVKCVTGCAKCCLRCVEKICDYLNTSAYAMMAISGQSFCTSGWNGFLLNLKHCAKFGWSQSIAMMFIFVGKMGIVMFNLFSLYIIMTKVTKDVEVTDYTGPMLVVGITSYISATVFLGMFDEAVLALMMSYAVDLDIGDG